VPQISGVFCSRGASRLASLSSSRQQTVAYILTRTTSRGDRRYDVRMRTPARVVTKTFRTRRDAERYIATSNADQIRGAWVDPRAGRISLREYAERWLADHPSLRPRTRETYECYLRRHINPTLGHVDLVDLSPGTIRAWHSGVSRKSSPIMAAKTYRLLRTILNTAATDELIVRNPCRLDGAGIERPAERPQITPDQVFELADHMPDRFRALVLVAGFVGLRQGELLGLRTRHVDLLHATLTVEQQEQQLKNGQLIIGPPKTAAGVRTLALPKFLVRELEGHFSRFGDPDPDGRVFAGEQGGPLRRHVLQKHWTRARNAVPDLPAGFRFHDLRHTANTIAAGTGVSLKDLMYRMGHASPQAALRYQHATRERDQFIADAVDSIVATTRT
jgi:integrase